jgi:hypothetical protein
MRKIELVLVDHLLTSEGGINSLFGGVHTVLVPPHITTAWLPPVANRETEANRPTLLYPFPSSWSENWLKELTETQKQAPREIDWQVYSWGPIFRDVDFSALESIGWRWLTQTEGMLNEFVGLAFEEVTEEVTENAIDQVRRFAKKWGPLWQCRIHPFFCHWSQRGLLTQDDRCGWAPGEEIREYIRKAWEAKAVLTIVTLLQNNSPIPEYCWKWLYMNSHTNTRQELQTRIENLLNVYLLGNGGPTLRAAWDKGSGLKLTLQTDIGFIHAVWMEIAQALCHGRGFIQCDGCGSFYLREGRKSKVGQRNFCFTCRKGNRGTKRLSAQARRDRERVK